MLLAVNLRARVGLFAALRTRAELEQQSARLVREPSSETRTRAQAREFARCARSELRAGFTSARFPRPPIGNVRSGLWGINQSPMEMERSLA